MVTGTQVVAMQEVRSLLLEVRGQSWKHPQVCSVGTGRAWEVFSLGLPMKNLRLSEGSD